MLTCAEIEEDVDDEENIHDQLHRAREDGRDVHEADLSPHDTTRHVRQITTPCEADHHAM